MTEPITPQPMDPEARAAALAQAVAGEVARGARVESQTPTQAIVVYGKPVNHVLHAILTFVTCFFWGIVWIILAATQGEKRSVLSIDQYGNLLRQ